MSVIPKIIGLLVVLRVLRKVIMKSAGRHGAGSAWAARRRRAIAELHRELHGEAISA